MWALIASLYVGNVMLLLNLPLLRLWVKVLEIPREALTAGILAFAALGVSSERPSEPAGSRGCTWRWRARRPARGTSSGTRTATPCRSCRSQPSFAEDVKGNRETDDAVEIRIDRTPPAIAGLPRHCVLWPPNGRLVHVADVTSADALSGPGELVVRARSFPRGSPDDIVIDGGSVDLRAEKARGGALRVYRIRARATDQAGNVARDRARCVVPHSQRPGGR